MLRGYADAHVVFTLVQALRQRGMDIVRVQDRGREHADDVDLLDEALADERVMLTNDTDFLVLAAERLASWSKASFAKRTGRITRRLFAGVLSVSFACPSFSSILSRYPRTADSPASLRPLARASPA